MLGRSHHLAKIVRGHIRGHADGNAGTTIDQQVRNRGRQHSRLLKLVIVIRREIDGIFGDIGIHAQRGRRHTSLGITRSSRTVIERTEIAVTVHQWQPHRERLRQTYHRLVNRGIAMRMELAHHFANHTRRLHIRPVRIEVHLTHLIDDASLHRLETVPGIRQRSGVNHRIRVFEERFAHFLVQRRFDDVLLDRTRVKGWFCRFAVRHHAVVLLTERLW